MMLLQLILLKFMCSIVGISGEERRGWFLILMLTEADKFKGDIEGWMKTMHDLGILAGRVNGILYAYEENTRSWMSFNDHHDIQGWDEYQRKLSVDSHP